MTALHWACKKGTVDLVKFLLISGSDLKAKDMVFLKICEKI